MLWNFIRAFLIVSLDVKTSHLLGHLSKGSNCRAFSNPFQIWNSVIYSFWRSCFLTFLLQLCTWLSGCCGNHSNNLVRKYDVTVCLILFSRCKTSTELPSKRPSGTLRAFTLLLLILMSYEIVCAEGCACWGAAFPRPGCSAHGQGASRKAPVLACSLLW